MQRNIDGETTAILLIVMLIVVCVLTGCSGAPTLQEANLKGSANSISFGPIPIIKRQF